MSVVKTRNEAVQLEFTEEEMKPCALDKLNAPTRDFSSIRHKFVSNDQYDLFCMLPGTDETKLAILDALSSTPIDIPDISSK